MKRVDDLKQYILAKYPKVQKDRLDVLKVGLRVYIILVTRQNTLAREKLYRGSIDGVEGVQILQKLLDDKIEAILTKHGYN